MSRKKAWQEWRLLLVAPLRTKRLQCHSNQKKTKLQHCCVHARVTGWRDLFYLNLVLFFAFVFFLRTLLAYTVEACRLNICSLKLYDLDGGVWESAEMPHPFWWNASKLALGVAQNHGEVKKRDRADLQKYSFGSNIERNRPQFFWLASDWTCIQTTQGLRTAIGEKSKPITKGKFFPWAFLVCFVTQDTWPAQDSNLESPAPEADALSIGPTGHHIWKIVAVGCIVLGIPIQTNKTSRPHHKILNC